MASSVLGKRARSLRDEGLTSSGRAKRRTTTEIFNDEKDNPFITRPVCAKIEDVSYMELDELADERLDKSNQAKRGALGARVSPLSTNIKTHFNTAKPVTDENEFPVQNPTPKTPRHRDAFSKRVPVTPRHYVLANGSSSSPKTPRTPLTPSVTTVYNTARQLFTRSADPGQLVGRDEERKELTDFISSRIKSNCGGCTYVSGPPGTGKSALVGEVTGQIPEQPVLKKAAVNCMSMKTSRDIYSALLEAFWEGHEVLEGEEIHTLQAIFQNQKRSTPMYLVTLDEIDHFLTVDLDVLYKLFEWSLQKSSRLVLIGIANALDLTDRFLPRLKARNLKPYLLPFLPYNASQIKTVITTKLRSLLPADNATPDYVPFVHPAAIELCSRKVSSQTGDLRKAFDICRQAIELVESETKQKHLEALEQQIQASPSRKPLRENSNLSSPSIQLAQLMFVDQPPSVLTVLTAPRATIGHLNKVTAAVFGHGANQRLRALNLQQKAALCALVALEQKKRTAAANVMATPSKSINAAPTVKALYDAYCLLCRREAVLHPLTSTEFRDVVGTLETLSLISAVDGKNGSFVPLGTPSKRGRKAGFGGGVGAGDEKRVGSCVGERELLQAVEGVGGSILTSILRGEGID